MFKNITESIDKTIDKAQGFIEKNGEDIVACAALGIGAVFLGTLVVKIIPSRTNVHLYFHIN